VSVGIAYPSAAWVMRATCIRDRAARHLR